MSNHGCVLTATLLAVWLGIGSLGLAQEMSLVNGDSPDAAVIPTAFQEGACPEADHACCAGCFAGSLDPCSICCCNTGLIGYVEYVNWQARRRGMDYASFLDPVWLTPRSIESLEYDRDSGFRVGLGYRFATCWEVSWNYTYFHTDTSGGIQAEDGPGILNSTRSYLDVRSPIGTPFDTVWAEAELQYDVHDIEVGRHVLLNQTTAVRLFGSFRWARIDQGLRISHTYRDIFANGVTGRISNPTGMNGYGIRLGAEGHWTSGCGVRLFGRGAASVLVGDFHTRQVEMDEIEGAIIDFSEDYTQAVPVLEVALGAAWSRGPFEISGGYELSSWFNMAEVGRSSYDLVFDGFFVRLAIFR